jgi:hypothetical protein
MPKYSKHSLRDRLATLIQRLESGKAVQARDVELALTKEQHAAMQAEWMKQQQLRKPSKPQSITAYEKALKSAAMWQGRLDAYQASKPTTYRVFVDREAKQKEMELKVLAELANAKQLLRDIGELDVHTWLDREFSATAISAMALDSMPRSITSRSSANQVKSQAKQKLGIKSITEVKLAAMRLALQEANAEIEKEWGSQTSTQEQTQKLSELLVKLKAQR